MMMKEKYFTCKLLSDVVLNASLATEGNMETLDYIPGSNFLGIVAAALYPKMQGKEDEVYDLFHSNRVSYGDAVICDDGQSIFYTKPFTYFKDKLEKDANIYLHHMISEKDIKDENGNKIQLKQERSGFLNGEGFVIKEVKKTFALKSAQDRETRSSKESAMFGFESIKAGQVFMFSVRYEDENDMGTITKYLVGTKYIGKSKSAQYGKVDIQSIEGLEKLKKIGAFEPQDFILVYAESNLCFLDELTGQSTFQPTADQLGLSGGTVDWSKSSIRTYSYSPWNFKRNASNTQRNCIAKGSVFYVTNGKASSDSRMMVGEYLAEGLGRVLYNPSFLQGNSEGKLTFKIEQNIEKVKVEKPKVVPIKANIKTNLGKALLKKYDEQVIEKQIAENVILATQATDSDLKNNITSSQWGNIRALATDYYKTGEGYEKFLFALFHEASKEEKDRGIKNAGMLTHGKMFDKLWDKSGRLNKFKEILKEHSNGNLIFVAKYSAEMAKIYIDIKAGKIKKEEK
jgi:hypothetical protein